MRRGGVGGPTRSLCPIAAFIQAAQRRAWCRTTTARWPARRVHAQRSCHPETREVAQSLSVGLLRAFHAREHLGLPRHRQPVDLAVQRCVLLLLRTRLVPVERVLRGDGERAERESLRDRLRRVAALVAGGSAIRAAATPSCGATDERPVRLQELPRHPGELRAGRRDRPSRRRASRRSSSDSPVRSRCTIPNSRASAMRTVHSARSRESMN